MPRFRFVLLLLPLVSAAAPPEPPADLICRANAAFLAGDAATADALYAAAEERTGDPGLVAFNRAAVLFQRGEFRDAELHYARTLDDAACPPDRAARAWFNRGTCLVRRGGDAKVFRSAAACFERCLDLTPADATLVADARHNLELAKVLWAEAVKKTGKPETPNAPVPEEIPDRPPPKQETADPSRPQPKDKGTGKVDPKTGTTPAVTPKIVSNPMGTPVPAAGQTLPDLSKDDAAQPLSPEDTRAYLKQTEQRLRRERQGMWRTLAPDRPGVLDR